MRLGGPVFGEFEDPAAWAEAHRAAGYRAAFCPAIDPNDDARIQAYAKAAADADIVIAEVGAWSSPLSQHEKTAAEAMEKCKNGLALADKIGARCCVNIAGSLAEGWAYPHPKNLTQDTFDRIVEIVREIIDAVKPTRSFYALETMPYMYPDSADSYLDLIKAIDRKGFAVHFDPVNFVCSPRIYYNTADMIRESVAKLGPHIRSCHAKDIAMEDAISVRLGEVRPGTGGLDYAVFLQEISKLDPDTPVLLEHLFSAEDYRLAAEHVRAVGKEEGIAL